MSVNTKGPDSSHVFEMPVPIRVYNTQRSDSADFKLIHTSNSQEFIIEPGFVVDELAIDPEYWLVSKTSEIVKTATIPISDNFVVYPNPFGNSINVIIPENEQIIETRLLTLDGKLIQKIAGNQTEFHWGYLPEGIYILQIKTSSKFFEKRILKG